jgi:hypothetical protein
MKNQRLPEKLLADIDGVLAVSGMPRARLIAKLHLQIAKVVEKLATTTEPRAMAARLEACKREGIDPATPFSIATNGTQHRRP